MKKYRIAFSYQDYLDICKENHWRSDLYIPNEYGIRKARTCSKAMKAFRDYFDKIKYSKEAQQGCIKAYRRYDEMRIRYMVLATNITKTLHEMEDGELFDAFIEQEDCELETTKRKRGWT